MVENSNVNSLATLASTTGTELMRKIPMRLPTILEKKHEVNMIDERLGYKDPNIKFLRDETLFEDKLEARRLKYKAQYYTLINGMLYKRGFLSPYLRCLSEAEVNYVFREIHEKVCEDHSGSQSLSHKVVR